MTAFLQLVDRSDLGQSCGQLGLGLCVLQGRILILQGFFGNTLGVQRLCLVQIFATDGEIRPISFQKLVAPLPGRSVIKPETAQAIRKMLEMVTQPGGTALRAQVAGYRVGGKTGTAHKLAGGAYATDKYVGSFVGIAPMSAPRLIVAVMIDEPEPIPGRYYGGYVAAPVFSAVVAGSLRVMGIAPDAPQNVPQLDMLGEHVKEEM